MVKKYIQVVLLLLSATVLLFGQDSIDMDAAVAAEEFRNGITSFHGGYYNNAILAFEQALSRKPGNSMYRKWLGEAYYYAGYTENTINIWSGLLSGGENAPVLESKLDFIDYQLDIPPEITLQDRYVRFHTIHGIEDDSRVFTRPAAVKARPDGGFYCVAYATSEVIVFDANGKVEARYTGGLFGLDHPMDILENGDGSVFITEFRGDRVTKWGTSGQKIMTIGGPGLAEGKLTGPQYMARDEDGYLYITEWGNKRVSKFDDEGNFILSFGEAAGLFEGLGGPSGITVHGAEVFVADKKNKCIQKFDKSGNHIKSIGTEILAGPEGLEVWKGDYILVADTNRIMAYSPIEDKFYALMNASAEDELLVYASGDVNNNIMISDFNSNTITFLTDFSSVYSGLFSRIERVDASSFPRVIVDIYVEDRYGNPLVGLDMSNFVLTERNRGPYEIDLEYSSYNDSFFDVSLLMDKSVSMQPHVNDAAEFIHEFSSAFAGSDTARVITAGELPEKQSRTGFSELNVIQRALKSGGWSRNVSFDLGLKMAADEIVTSVRRKAVVYVTDSSQQQLSFDSHDIVPLARYLKNNHIEFYVCYVTPGNPGSELTYLVEQTGGRSIYLHNPEGMGQLTEWIRRPAKGYYSIGYNSLSNADFGQAFITVEVQTYHFQKSGRDESGFFGPLDVGR